MKSCKPILLTALLFFALLSTIFYTACEKNPCNNVTCYNGGSCNNGVCRCPTGWEGSQCTYHSIDRFTGTYGGFSTCNNSAYFIDTAFIYADYAATNTVAIKLKSISPKILHGYVSNNESTYSIVCTNNDSFKVGSQSYLKTWHITLQSDRNLNIESYEQNYVVVPIVDTTINKCTFVGVKD